MREELRAAHVKKYGSFLYCPERDTICSFMDGAWEHGCSRTPCILDDPEDMLLQERISKNRRRQIEIERKHRQEEKDAAPIRDQRNRIQSYISMRLDEIHRIEEQSRKAYLDNKPNKGDELFNKARFMRGELKKFEEKKRGEKNDRQGDQEDHRRDDEDRRPARPDGRRASDRGMHDTSGCRGAARAREILAGAAQADLGRSPEA